MMEECGSYRAELELFFSLFVCLRLQVQKSSHLGEIIAASLYIYVPWSNLRDVMLHNLDLSNKDKML